MIDERLRDYAERWRAAQRPPGPVPAVGRPRPVLPVAAAAAAVALVVVGAAVAVRDHVPATQGAVPWRPLPREHVSREPLPARCAPGAVTAGVSLRRNDVDLDTVGEVQGAILLRNTGQRTCTLGGAALDLVSPAGITVVEVGATRPGPLGPGAEERVEFVWEGPYCGTTATFELRLTFDDTGEAVAMTAPPLSPPCFAGGRASSLRWAAIDVEPPRAGLPLTARIEAPDQVRPGAVLRYVLVLENRTPERVPLDPCPTYTHSLEPAGGHYDFDPILGGRLHCEAAPEAVDPGGSVRFAMELAQPRPPGEHVLSVFVDGQGATAPVGIAGPEVRTEARPCGVDDYVVRGLDPVLYDRHRPPRERGRPAVTRIGLFNASGAPCDASVAPELRILRSKDGLVATGVSGGPARTAPVYPGETAQVHLTWHSWCGEPVFAYAVEVTIPGRPGRALVDSTDIDVPDCAPERVPAAETSWMP